MTPPGYGNLPHGVTIHDLMSVMDNNGRTALDALADEIHGSQIEAVLNASKANSFEEILKVGSTLERMKRVKVITWRAFQMKLLWTKNNS